MERVPLYVVLMGVQGAGKGTQAKQISECYGIPHISTGDLFRAMKSRDDDLARHIKQIMASGALVDDDTVNRVVEDRLDDEDTKNGAVLDGYPRTLQQGQWLDSHLST